MTDSDEDVRGQQSGSFILSKKSGGGGGKKKERIKRQQDKGKIETGVVSMENITGFSEACC